MQECPVCGCKTFFVHDSEDEYEIISFEFTPRGIVFSEEEKSEAELYPQREVYCDNCSWHGTCEQILSE